MLVSSNWNSHTAGKNAMRHTHFGEKNKLRPFLIKLKQTPCNPTNITGYLPKSNKSLCSHKNLDAMFTAALFIVQLPKTGTTQVILNWRMNKQNVVHPYNKIPLNNKKQQTTDTSNNTDKTPNALC